MKGRVGLPLFLSWLLTDDGVEHRNLLKSNYYLYHRICLTFNKIVYYQHLQCRLSLPLSDPSALVVGCIKNNRLNRCVVHAWRSTHAQWHRKPLQSVYVTLKRGIPLKRCILRRQSLRADPVFRPQSRANVLLHGDGEACFARDLTSVPILSHCPEITQLCVLLRL